MAFKIPQTVSVITGMFSIFATTTAAMFLAAIVVLFTEPENSLHPVQYFIIAAIPAMFSFLAVWSYKQEKKHEAFSKVKQAGPTDGRVSRTQAKKRKNQQR